MVKEEEVGKKENESNVSSEGPPPARGGRGGREESEKEVAVKGDWEVILKEMGSDLMAAVLRE